MKVRIDDVPPGGRVHRVEIDPRQVHEGLGIDRDTGTRWRSPVRGEIELHRESVSLRLKGTAHLALTQPCARCLAEIDQDLDLSFDLTKILGPAPERPQHLELDEEEIDQDYLEGTEIDLAEVLLEQVALETPTRALCTATCKGLCPACGADRNAGPCSCDARPIDPRFQILAGLLDEPSPDED